MLNCGLDKVTIMESEAVFDSLNLNPKLFINEAFNLVDDLLEEAFEFYLQHASLLLKTDGTDMSEELHKGIVEIRHMIQTVLDKRLGMWDKYCLQRCFAVPQGFSLHKDSESPGESSRSKDALYDPHLDFQLDSLRQKLTEVGKESAMLNREIRELERQSVSSNHFIELISKAVQLYEQNSLHDMHQEIKMVASELRAKMEHLKLRKIEEMERSKIEKIHNPGEDLLRTIHSKEMEDLQEFLAEL